MQWNHTRGNAFVRALFSCRVMFWDLVAKAIDSSCLSLSGHDLSTLLKAKDSYPLPFVFDIFAMAAVYQAILETSEAVGRCPTTY